MNLRVNETRQNNGGAALQRAVHGAHFGDLEQSFPLRRAQIARDGYLSLDAVKARGLAVATDVAVLRVDLRVREVDLDGLQIEVLRILFVCYSRQARAHK